MKPPKDVLELGRHLVHELGSEDEVDTLGRWMAHYLAELIDETENGSAAAQRIARKEAMETILKIWGHRALLPGKAYPLAPYGHILEIINRLRPENNPFQYLGRQADNKREQLAAVLFDELSRLIIALLLVKLTSGKQSVEAHPAVIEALSDTEKRVLTALQEWEKLFEPASKDTGLGQKNKKGADHAKVNLDEAAIRLVDSIAANLIELRSELQGTGRQHVTIEVKR